MPVSGQYIAFGAVADAIGKRLQQKRDDAHKEETDRQTLINQGLMEGLKSGAFKNPNDVFELMVNGGKPRGKGAKGKESKIPSPLRSLIDTIKQHGQGGGAGASQPSAPSPQWKTSGEMDTEAAQAAGAKAGATRAATLNADEQFAQSLIDKGVPQDEAYERAGLKAPVPKAPPSPGSEASMIYEALDIAEINKGSPLSLQERHAVIEETRTKRATENKAGGKGPSTILKDMSGTLRAFVEPRLSAAGIIPSEATDEDIKKVLPGASKAALDKEKEGAVNAQLLAETRQIALKLAQGGTGPSGLGMGQKGPGGEELPLVTLDATGRPDPAQQAEFIKAFPQDLQSMIKGMADYTLNPSNITTRPIRASGGMGGMTRAQMIAWVKQYDPSYSDVQFGARSKLENEWVHGKVYTAMQASNTVIQHFGELAKAAAALAPYTYGVEEVNKATYGVRRRSNAQVRDAIRKYETARDAVALELRKVYSGTSGGSEKEIDDWQRNASTTAPTDEKRAFLEQAANLLFGKVNTATQQYKAQMGRSPKTGIGISAKSLEVLTSLGIDLSGLDDAIKPGNLDDILGPKKQ